MRGRSLVIGALTTHNEVATSKTVKDEISALAEVASLIGDPAVRHRGSIRGSIANNDPNADYPAACLSLAATIITNKRRIPADGMASDIHGSAEHRAHLVGALARRAVVKAVA